MEQAILIEIFQKCNSYDESHSIATLLHLISKEREEFRVYTKDVRPPKYKNYHAVYRQTGKRGNKGEHQQPLKW